MQDITNYSTNYFILSKVETDESSIKCSCTVVKSQMLVGYLLEQAEKPWYNYYKTAGVEYTKNVISEICTSQDFIQGNTTEILFPSLNYSQGNVSS